MGAKGEALAKQFEAKARDAVTAIESLSDAEWKKVTAAEQWTVAATAHTWRGRSRRSRHRHWARGRAAAGRLHAAC
jgi:hypothetical protein